MKKLLFSLVVILLNILFVFLIHQQSYATDYPPNGATKTFSEVKNGVTDCAASTGLGFNTVGGSWTPTANGADNFACDGSSGIHGNTCVFSQSNGCFGGYGGSGVNPSSADGGCIYNQNTATPIACPQQNFQVTMQLKDNSGNPITSNATVDVYDNGHTEQTLSPDGNGNVSFYSWSGDHIILTPQSNQYTFSPPNIEGNVNSSDTMHCGTQLGWPTPSDNPNGPCIFTASTGNAGGGSPSPASGSTVNINLIVGLQGIGAFGNPPKDGSRSVTVELYDAASSIKPGSAGSILLGSGTGKVNYDNTSDSNAGYFTTTNVIPVTLTGTSPSGTYAILIKIPQYLYTLAVNDPNADSPDAFTFNSGDTITTSPTVMHSGGISGNNANLNSVGVDDYTAMLACFQQQNCPQTTDGIMFADLDDSGTVDIVDFNILYRSIYQLTQVQNACSGITCNGD